VDDESVPPCVFTSGISNGMCNELLTCLWPTDKNDDMKKIQYAERALQATVGRFCGSHNKIDIPGEYNLEHNRFKNWLLKLSHAIIIFKIFNKNLVRIHFSWCCLRTSII